jgi:hypothetical protein
MTQLRMTFEEYWASRVNAYTCIYPGMKNKNVLREIAHNAWIAGQLTMLQKLPEPDIEYPDND